MALEILEESLSAGLINVSLLNPSRIVCKTFQWMCSVEAASQFKQIDYLLSYQKLYLVIVKKVEK